MNKNKFSIADSLKFILDKGCKSSTVHLAKARLLTIEKKLTEEEFNNLEVYLDWLIWDAEKSSSLDMKFHTVDHQFEVVGVRTDFSVYTKGLITKYRTDDTDWEDF